MEITVLSVVAVLAAIVSQLIRKNSPEISTVLTIGAGVLIASNVIGESLPFIHQIQALLRQVPTQMQYAGILVKVLGVCLLVQFASDACRDAGESSLASGVEFAGRVAVALLALPMFEDVLELALSFMK